MDWDKIIDEYGDLLANQPDTGPVIRDVAELPYPRAIIRAAFLHCLQTENDAQLRDAMKSCFLTLPAYQALSPEERHAVQVWSDFGDPSTPEETKALAERMHAVLPVFDAVKKRFEEDAASFAADLENLETEHVEGEIVGQLTPEAINKLLRSIPADYVPPNTYRRK